MTELTIVIPAGISMVTLKFEQPSECSNNILTMDNEELTFKDEKLIIESQ